MKILEDGTCSKQAYADAYDYDMLPAAYACFSAKNHGIYRLYWEIVFGVSPTESEYQDDTISSVRPLSSG